VRVISCSLFGFFQYGGKFVVLGWKSSHVVWLFFFFSRVIYGCNCGNKGLLTYTLTACFTFFHTSMEQERFFKFRIFFAWAFLYQVFVTFTWNTNAGWFLPRKHVVFRFITNSIKVKYKVTLLVQKQRNKCYISSVVFPINLNWKKVPFLFFKNGWNLPLVFVWQKSRRWCSKSPKGRFRQN